jgi:hypothetical protein
MHKKRYSTTESHVLTSARSFVLTSVVNTGTATRYRLDYTYFQDAEKEGFDPGPNIFAMGLEYYVYQRIMQHALNYEKDTHLLSRTLLRSTMNALIAGDLDWNLIAAQYILKQHVANADYRHLLCSDVNIAAIYGLYLYVEEAISQSPAILTTYVDSFTSIMPLSSTSSKSNPPKRQLSLPRSSGASLLATATYISTFMPYMPECSRLVCLLAGSPLSPRLDDSDMLVAIEHLTKTEITALLVKFPSGQLKLRPSLLGHGSTFRGLYVTSRGEHDTDFAYGPLWAVGRRCKDEGLKYFPDPEGTLGILDLFLERREDINSRCGPYGTFLHAVVHYFYDCDYSDYDAFKTRVKAFFGEFVARDADLKTTGPYGNVLEYTWKQAHIDFQRRHGFFIKLLVGLEVQNSVRDPNGQIPSREGMLAVSEKDKLDAQDMSLYYHGTPTRSEEWHEVKNKLGEYKLERRPRFEPRGAVGAEDAASMQSTIPMADSSSGGSDGAVSRDVRARSIEEEC